MPAYVAPLVQGGSSALGNLFSAREAKKSWRRTLRLQERTSNQEYARQKEFAQMGIQWKVADAKAAGLHPLYALGAMPSNYSPSMMQSPSEPSSGIGESLHDAGQSISRAMMATRSNEQKQAEQMALEAHAANMAESDMRRQVLESERDRNYQEMNRGIWDSIPSVNPVYPDGQSPIVMPDYSPAGTVPQGLVKPSAATSISTARGDTSVAAGSTPMWREYTLSGNRKIVLPGGMAGDAAEVLESVGDSIPLMLAVAAENERRYGSSSAVPWFGSTAGWKRKIMSVFSNENARWKDLKRRTQGTARGARWRNGKIEYYW